MVPSRPPWPSTWPPVAAAEATHDACRVQRRPERRCNMGIISIEMGYITMDLIWIYCGWKKSCTTKDFKMVESPHRCCGGKNKLRKVLLKKESQWPRQLSAPKNFRRLSVPITRKCCCAHASQRLPTPVLDARLFSVLLKLAGLEPACRWCRISQPCTVLQMISDVGYSFMYANKL